MGNGGHAHEEYMYRGGSIKVRGRGERGVQVVRMVTASFPSWLNPALHQDHQSPPQWAVSSLYLVESCCCIWPCKPLPPPRNIFFLDFSSSMVSGNPLIFSVPTLGLSFSPLLIISVAHPEFPTFSTFSLWILSFRPMALPPSLSS